MNEQSDKTGIPLNACHPALLAQSGVPKNAHLAALRSQTVVSHDYACGPVRPRRPLHEPRPTIKKCALCNKSDVALSRCEGGHICQECMDAGRRGRDATTKAVRLIESADELLKNTKEIDPVLRDAVLTKRGEIANLLVLTVAQDANAHRLDLLDRVSTDAVALALDAENSMQPANSLERMWKSVV